MAQVTDRPVIDIGSFRKIKLWQNVQGRYEVRWCDANRGHVTKRESCQTAIRAEADAYIDTFCDNARQTAAQAPRGPVAVIRPTIDVLCAKWLDDAELAGKHRSNRHILAPVRRALGGYLPEALVQDDTLLRDYRRARSHCAANTIRRELTALQTVINWSIEERLISAADKPSIKKLMPPQGAARDKFLDRDQERWLWDQAMAWGTMVHPGTQRGPGAYRVMVFIALALETAARHGAIMDLTWDRVDLTRGMIDYRRPGMRITKKRRVQLPISTRLRPVLEAARALAPEDASGQATGKVIDGTTDIKRALRTFTKFVGMPWVTAHVLRHTWATLAATGGVPLLDISKIMGDTLATIEAHYAHLTPDYLRKSIDFKDQQPVPALRVAS
jgi:integrase